MFAKETYSLKHQISFLQNNNNDMSAEYHFMPFSVGKRAEFWCKNCIAAGRAAGYLQDFTIDQLHLVQSAALRLVTLFPATKKYEINCFKHMPDEAILWPKNT